MSSTTPIRVNLIFGNVTKEAYGKASKSERDAILLVTDDTRYVLRRKSGPVFGDNELEKLVGHKVECDGFIVGGTFLADRIEIVKSKD